jgi:hypothetical protein
MSVAHSQVMARAEIVTELFEARVLITCMRGYVTAAVSAGSFQEFREQANVTHGAIWIIDTMAITGFQPSAVQVGARWFDVFKARAGKQIIMVSDNAAVRMAAATLAFAVHIKVASYRTLADAYAGAGLKPKAVRPSSYSFSPPKAGVP